MRFLLTLPFFLLVGLSPLAGQQTKLNANWVKALQWRNIGPATMGGRIVDVEVVASDPYTFYVATASGGLFKTTNNGTNFVPVFDKESSVSIGDVCVSSSHPDIVWVGTGEHNARNSVSWGDGVYKSTDGGKTWSHMGLKKSFQIGRIAIHPRNPDIVYVGALGRLWGPNPERGLYKTTDGGKTWSKILHVDDKTGCIDIAMNPTHPDTLIVAMYERQRDEFSGGDPAKRWGPGSGLFKTTDGGKTWHRLKRGLPTRPMGRIGVAYFAKNPEIVYAIIETDKIGSGPPIAYVGVRTASDDAVINSVVPKSPAAQAGLMPGDRFLAIGSHSIENYKSFVSAVQQHRPGQKVPVKVKRGDREITLTLTLGSRPQAYRAALGGQQANVQHLQHGLGYETGGVFRSEDGGESWRRVNSLNPRPFYYSQIRVDPNDDRYVYVLGIQFHVSRDGGKTFATSANTVHPDHHALWIDPRDGRHLILGCDGGLYISYDRGQTWDFHNIMAIGQFYDVGVDTRKPYRVYGGLQDNGSWGGPSRTRTAAGPLNSDWVRVGGSDGFVCRVDPNNPDLVYYEAQYGRLARVNIRTGERNSITPPRGKRYRFNWKTPFLLSHKNSKIYYAAGNVVFRSLDRGNDLQPISPEITRTDRGSATALAESPRDPNVLYVGTDDGYLWVTRDGGDHWQNITKNVNLPGHFHVSSIEPSRFANGRAYVAFDAHRSDNDRPFVYVTEDYGKTWKPLHDGLPDGSSLTVREDRDNPNLLYLGTEFGIWASLDRGASWTRINNNLPTVAIHEIAVHPNENEIVVATHGRSIWILDVTPLRGATRQALSAPAYLFKPADAVQYAGQLSTSQWGNRRFVGSNPPYGARLFYHLAADAKNVTLEIRDVQGRTVQRLRAANKAGLHETVWNLRRGPARRGQRPAPVQPGSYLVRLVVDGHEWTQPLRVEADPEIPKGRLLEELLEFEENEAENDDKGGDV
ncbi:MAG: hypothetical protein KatS3mg105_0774 [Gemmatales bacterium]|nr:MAG: hypothetical protein KatS3mg105_0774 [Gemmatales bacterium]